MGVCVLTDPSAVMPREWTRTLPIHLVPLDIAWPDGHTQPGDVPYAEVAGRLAAGGAQPTTGAPSPGTYATLTSELLGSHDGVLIVCPSSELSATFESAKLGAQEVGDDRVCVLDSKTAAAGQGLIASEAAKVAASGASLAEVSDRAVTLAPRVHIWATLSQLDFLSRSGRVPVVAAFGAGRLGLQPIVRYAGGSPHPVGVVRTTDRGVDRLYRAWERSIDSHTELHAIAFHSGREADARRLVSQIAGVVPSSRSDVVEVTAALASHTGGGLLGLAWFWENEAR